GGGWMGGKAGGDVGCGGGGGGGVSVAQLQREPGQRGQRAGHVGGVGATGQDVDRLAVRSHGGIVRRHRRNRRYVQLFLRGATHQRAGQAVAPSAKGRAGDHHAGSVGADDAGDFRRRLHRVVLHVIVAGDQRREH